MAVSKLNLVLLAAGIIAFVIPEPTSTVIGGLGLATWAGIALIGGSLLF